MPTKNIDLFRSSFALHMTLKDGLNKAVAISGADSVNNLLTRIAQDPEAAGEALRPVFERQGGKRGPSVAAALRQAKETGLSSEEIAAALAAAAAAKGNSNG